MSGVVAFLLTGTVAVPLSAQQSVALKPSLVFDGVTVVDVEQGKLVPAQQVVIAGNRIQSMDVVGTVKLPPGTRVVDARGKYLIPGLWDMHHHTVTSLAYLLLLANGVTGMRDAGSEIPLDTLLRWRREILAGTRVGPPRQILSGRFINEGCTTAQRGVCVANGDTAGARRVVEALRAAGADMIKAHDISSRATYFAIAAAARRAGVPFGGHATGDAIEDSDSGASILDHSGVLGAPCSPDAGSVEDCRKVAERFWRNGTWWVPTCIGFSPCGAPDVYARFDELMGKFVTSVVLNPYAPDPAGHNAFHGTMPDISPAGSAEGTLMHLPQEAGVPILVGTDVVGDWPSPGRQVTGFALHAELAMDVVEGLTPLNVLQGATLNPAQFLHAADSLGTVAPGKLADLVLLDADPLADITNTTTIRAVVANGRYYDRAALDQLLAEAQTRARQQNDRDSTATSKPLSRPTSQVDPHP